MATNNFRRVLENERITQAEICRKSGFSSTTIGKIYNERSNGAPTTQAKVVDAINNLTGNDYEIIAIFPNYGR
nr:hypothetical protein [uncultured Desulfobacter sp.]